MQASHDYEIVQKSSRSRGTGNLKLVIKRKKLASPSVVNGICNLSDKERFVEKLRAEESRFQNASISSYYDRPSVSYETLIQMAFAELNGGEQGRGLQAHEIAQWLCRK